MRGRNRNNKGPNPLTRSYESNGPDVKIRGTAQHITEKYSQLARDAEHYYRIIAAAQEQLREQYGYQQRFDDDGDEEGGFASGDRFGEDPDLGSMPQPFEIRAERQERFGQDRPDGDRQPRFDRGDRQDRPERLERSERQDRPERGDRPERQDRPERGDRRERFQRDRGPRQDFQRGDGEPRQERAERGERPNRSEFRRERPREEPELAEAPSLPAFLTNPVRQPIAMESEAAPESAIPVDNGEANGEFRTRRRRRRTRFGADEAEGADAAPSVAETPAAE
jgi:hypothetical protein